MTTKQVTKDQFYAAIGPLNVHPCPIGEYPYTSEFKTPNGKIIGKTVGRYTNPAQPWPVVTDYFLEVSE
jgi:hypothetical protein